MEEEGTQNLGLLKAIVIVLGVLIIIMLAIMVGTVILRMNKSDDAAADAPPPVTGELGVPEGSSLQSVTPTEREVYLHVKDGRGADHLYVLDRRSGALLWQRSLTPAD